MPVEEPAGTKARSRAYNAARKVRFQTDENDYDEKVDDADLGSVEEVQECNSIVIASDVGAFNDVDLALSDAS